MVIEVDKFIYLFVVFVCLNEMESGKLLSRVILFIFLLIVILEVLLIFKWFQIRDIGIGIFFKCMLFIFKISFLFLVFGVMLIINCDFIKDIICLLI